jgi:DNA phosphorothioation-dependent restriction protein DptG
MFNKGGFIHRPGKKITLFPFIANASSLKDDVLEDLEDFKGIAGACFRECLSLSHDAKFDKDIFLESVCEKAKAPGNSNLKNVVHKIAFNDNGQLILFDILAYKHIRTSSPKENKTLINIARFMVAQWFEPEDQLELRNLAESNPSNLFYKLILDCLPQTVPATFDKAPYYQSNADLKRQFREDLKALMRDQQLFVIGFHEVLRYYFFYYVSSVCFKLNSFFSKPKERLYFSVEWEKMQGYRDAMINGWDLFAHQISSMFAHAITLEMLNHISGFDGQVAYEEIAEITKKLDQQGQEALAEEIETLTVLYREGIKDVIWAKFQPELSRTDNPVEKAIIKLYQSVVFQFDETNRSRAYSAYQQWMKDFTIRSYGRRRGQLGYSLALKKNFVLLLTRLMIANQERIRLKDFWEGLQRRGIFLDKVSQEHMIAHFENLNLLEKKSDSGDAQYIRKFNALES